MRGVSRATKKPVSTASAERRPQMVARVALLNTRFVGRETENCRAISTV